MTEKIKVKWIHSQSPKWLSHAKVSFHVWRLVGRNLSFYGSENICREHPPTLNVALEIEFPIESPFTLDAKNRVNLLHENTIHFVPFTLLLERKAFESSVLTNEMTVNLIKFQLNCPLHLQATNRRMNKLTDEKWPSERERRAKRRERKRANCLRRQRVTCKQSSSCYKGWWIRCWSLDT